MPILLPLPAYTLFCRLAKPLMSARNTCDLCGIRVVAVVPETGPATLTLTVGDGGAYLCATAELPVTGERISGSYLVPFDLFSRASPKLRTKRTAADLEVATCAVDRRAVVGPFELDAVDARRYPTVLEQPTTPLGTLDVPEFNAAWAVAAPVLATAVPDWKYAAGPAISGRGGLLTLVSTDYSRLFRSGPVGVAATDADVCLEPRDAKALAIALAEAEGELERCALVADSAALGAVLKLPGWDRVTLVIRRCPLPMVPYANVVPTPEKVASSYHGLSVDSADISHGLARLAPAVKRSPQGICELTAGPGPVLRMTAVAPEVAARVEVPLCGSPLSAPTPMAWAAVPGSPAIPWLVGGPMRFSWRFLTELFASAHGVWRLHWATPKSPAIAYPEGADLRYAGIWVVLPAIAAVEVSRSQERGAASDAVAEPTHAKP